jgi:hypothetical protein
MDGPRIGLEFSSEEMVPGSEPAIHLLGFGTDVGGVEVATLLCLKIPLNQPPVKVVSVFVESWVRRYVPQLSNKFFMATLKACFRKRSYAAAVLLRRSRMM